jgi:hypothetical protein
LPDGYQIYERAVLSPRIGQSPPGTDPSQSSPGEPAPTRPSGALPKSLSLVYRFNQSLNVPPLLVNETALAEPGARISLSLRGPSCGEVIGEDAGGTIYINGLAEIEMGESETDWLVCKVDEVPARDSHTVFLTRGHVLIEVVAFADAGVSGEEVIRLAGSFVEAK